MTRMNRAKILQYVAAVAATITSVLSDPEVRAFLVEHPMTTAGLLSFPSLMTFVGMSVAAVQRRKAHHVADAGQPEPVDEEVTDRIDP